jgi:hypothetical protein
VRSLDLRDDVEHRTDVITPRQFNEYASRYGIERHPLNAVQAPQRGLGRPPHHFDATICPQFDMSPTARSPHPATAVQDITEQRTQTLRDAHQSIVSSRMRCDPIAGWHRARRSFGRPGPDSERTGPPWRQARQWRRTELPREHRKTRGQSLETKSDGALRIEPPVRKFNRRRTEKPDPACDGHPQGAKHTCVARWWMLRNEKPNI